MDDTILTCYCIWFHVATGSINYNRMCKVFFPKGQMWPRRGDPLEMFFIAGKYWSNENKRSDFFGSKSKYGIKDKLLILVDISLKVTSLTLI